MKTVRTFAALAFACAILPAPVHASTDRTGTYLAPTAPSGGYVDVVGGYGVGGYLFAADGDKPVRIRIDDALGGPIGVSICQEGGDGVTCGVEQEWCGSGWYDIPDIGWAKNKSTAVFVHTMSLDCPDFGIQSDEAVATTGTITLRTA